MNRRTLLGLAAVAALGVAPADGGAQSTPATLRAVRFPCSLQKVADELSRRYAVRVFVDPALADLRVLWSFHGDPPIDRILARLAELTDSRLTAHTGASGTRRFTLERSLRTTQLEEAWRTAALARTLRELVRASRDYTSGKLDPATFSPNVRVYLRWEPHAATLKCLERLTPEQIGRLLRGEEILFPPGALPEAEVRPIFERLYRVSDYGPEWNRQQIELGMERVRRDGTTLQFEFGRRDGYFVLRFGPPTGYVLCRFGTEELGVPLTRTNPYRLLEPGADRQPDAPLPPAFAAPLAAPLRVSHGGEWDEVLAGLARVTGIDLLSDGYLSRRASRPRRPLGPAEVLAPAGLSLASALDRVCERYGYLWWPGDGCVYLRSRTWPWDGLYEVPDAFLDAWAGALGRHGAVSAAALLELSRLTLLQLNGLTAFEREHRTGIFAADTRLGREFREFFQGLAAGQQTRLLDVGVRVGREQVAAFGQLFMVMDRESVRDPFVVRLMQRVEEIREATPRRTRVTLKLDVSAATIYSPPLAVEIPQLPDPFAP